MSLINRTIEEYLHAVAGKYPVVTITGPRQSGKTTLCRKAFATKPYANLEAPDVRQFALDDPRGFLAQYPDGAIFDEIQRAPDLVSYLQPHVDEDPREGRFVLTGSQQFEVTTTITQSLAGRTALIKLLPFSIAEIQSTFSLPDNDPLLHRGFYPRIWDKDLDPTQALGDYFQTYIERDLRQLATIKDLNLFAKLFPDYIPGGSGLVYGGVDAQERTGTAIVPVSEIYSLFDRAGFDLNPPPLVEDPARIDRSGV